MTRISPILRISLGLVLMTMSFLLIGDVLGLLPNEIEAKLDARKRVSESLAVQFSIYGQTKDATTIQVIMDNLLEHNDDIVSLALRLPDHKLLAFAGEHEKHWTTLTDLKSTPTQLQVPIMSGDKVWGTVEILFKPLSVEGFVGVLQSPLFKLVMYFAFTGVVGYFLFMKRVLRELDPSKAIPARVKAAMDALSEGVLIIDENEQILLANKSFLVKTEQPKESLIGGKISRLAWMAEENGPNKNLPWVRALRDNEHVADCAITIQLSEGRQLQFMVNCAPIVDDKGNRRGALATFDDVTQLHERNRKLQDMLSLLKETQSKVETKNQELEILATHDSLTGCLNRRAFYEIFSKYFQTSQQGGLPLTVMMVDIDHFKSVNDRFGHMTGDEVIKFVTNTIKKCLRENDSVARYGGEEFSILLPNTDIVEAGVVAERIRSQIENNNCHVPGTGITANVTTSIGVSCNEWGAKEPGELLDQADKALYVAKRKGRNCIMSWDVIDTDHGDLEPEAQSGVEEVNEQSEYIVEARPATHGNRAVRLSPSAKSDTLTGLSSRTHFLRLLAQSCEKAVETGQMLALLLLDLDMFKRINETFGHVCGDLLLQEVSTRLGRILRSSDYVTRVGCADESTVISRLGGDEFGIMLADLNGIETVTMIVGRVIDILSEQFIVNGQSVYISASIGISLCPQHGVSAQTLFRDADIAMYQAKRDGRNNYRFFSQDMQKTTFQQLQMEGLLREAVEKEQFLLHYQPCIDLKSGKISRFEALIRWNNPQCGLVSPTDFIPIAEYTGLIIPIGEWVLRNACQQIKAWLELGYDDIRVAVNLSPRQFRTENLSGTILGILDAAGVPPLHLEVEITEGTIMQDVEAAAMTMERLHGQGVAIAIDDFGTGYSSLSYLRNFSIDYLKIDRSFVTRTKDSEKDVAIVNAIIAMGHAMNLRIVAEGVETQDQCSLLQEMNCDEIQGFVFSPPVSAKTATEMLVTQRLQATRTLRRDIGTAG